MSEGQEIPTLDQLITAVGNCSFDCAQHDGTEDEYKVVLDASKAARQGLKQYVEQQLSSLQKEKQDWIDRCYGAEARAEKAEKELAAMTRTRAQS